MTTISLSHVHKTLPNPRLGKPLRLLLRTCIAITIICLPLSPPHTLSSLSLIATTTSLVVLVLILDLFGNSCAGDRFWTGGFCKENRRRTTYTASCRVSRVRRRMMQEKVAKGERVGLADVLEGGRGGASGMSSSSTLLEEGEAEKGRRGADHSVVGGL